MVPQQTSGTAKADLSRSLALQQRIQGGEMPDKNSLSRSAAALVKLRQKALDFESQQAQQEGIPQQALDFESQQAQQAGIPQQAMGIPTNPSEPQRLT